MLCFIFASFLLVQTMSTKFGIFKIPIETDTDGCITSSYTEDDYVEIASQSNGGGVFWVHPFDIVAHHLDDSAPVYPLDNTPQGIYTVADIKREAKKNE